MSLPTEILLTNHKASSEQAEADLLRSLGTVTANTNGPSDCLQQMDTTFSGNTGTLVSIDSEDCPSDGIDLARRYVVI
jgi:hypothetical protein